MNVFRNDSPDPSGPQDVQETSFEFGFCFCPVVSSAEHLLAEGATLSLAALVAVCSTSVGFPFPPTVQNHISMIEDCKLSPLNSSHPQISLSSGSLKAASKGQTQLVYTKL